MKRKQTTRSQATPTAHRAIARSPRRRSSRAEDRLKSILHATAEFYGIWNTSQGPLYLGESSASRLGNATDTPSNPKALEDLIHPDELAFFQSQLSFHLSGKTPTLDCEFRLRNKDGFYRWFQMLGRTLCNHRRGAGIELSYAVRDIHERKELDCTEHKRAVEALRDSEERLRTVMNAGHLYAFEWDVASDMIEQTQKSTILMDCSENQSGLTRQELINRIHLDDRANYTRTLQSLTPEKPDYRVVFRFLLLNGHTACLEETGRAIFGPDKQLCKVFGIISDVTEARQSERAFRELSRRLIRSQEEERRRIARELHDHIGQEAALLCVQAQRIDSGVADEEHTTRSDVHELYRRIQVLTSDISKLSHRLHSSELSFLGLAVAADRLCRDFASQYGINVDYQAKSAPPMLDSTKSLCLYRVLQEALQNVAKHSHASRVSVTLHTAERELVLEVTDNGTGFECGEATTINSGLGVLSMRERLNLVAGRFAIVSTKGTGTTVTAAVAL